MPPSEILGGAVVKKILSSLFAATVLLAAASCFAGAGTASAPPSAAGKDAVALLSDGRVMVLGDSITQNGAYVSFLEYLLEKQNPGRTFDIVSAGLASETTSGLSEEGHAGGAFPRPCVHERLQRALDAVKPRVVVACYGMNDGIYKPYSEATMKAFRDGVTKLAAACQTAGAKVILVTPPIFEGGAYDGVLGKFAAWESAQPPPGVVAVADLHTAMAAARAERQTADPKFRFSGDNVHPGELGHLVMALSILKGLKIAVPAGKPEELLPVIKADPLYKAVCQHRETRSNAWLAHIGYTREKTVAPGTGDIAAAEARAAEFQAQADAIRRLARPDGKPCRIACVGDSITAGAGLKDPGRTSYPARLQALFGPACEVRNFGVSARTMQKAGDHPYWNEKAFTDAKAFAPDIVLIKLGTNDTKPQNWNAQRFAADAHEMVAAFQALPSKPRVCICLPVPVFKADQWGIRAAVVKNEVLPILRQTAFDTGADLVNLHTPMLDDAACFPDTVHPNAEGADRMARRIARHLAQPEDPAFDLAAKLPKGAARSNFHGYAAYDFRLNGRACKVVLPKRAAARHSWVWRMEFFGHEPQADLALLENGFHLLYIDTYGLNGSPLAMPHWEALYDFAIKNGLAPKAALIGLSRGGLYAYNWAVAHPERVTCIYGDAPVLDIRSWPGGKGKSKGSPGDWQASLKQYGLTEETAAAWKGPLDKLDLLAKAGIPLIHVVGDADDVVPVAENTAILEERYKKLGGVIEVIHKPGCNHHPHSLPNPEAVVTFILRACGR